MSFSFSWRSLLPQAMLATGLVYFVQQSPSLAQVPAANTQPLNVASTAGPGLNGAGQGIVAQTGHPLDPALAKAKASLQHIKANVKDYTCTMVKRERINGDLGEQEFMLVKVRQRTVQRVYLLPQA